MYSNSPMKIIEQNMRCSSLRHHAYYPTLKIKIFLLAENVQLLTSLIEICGYQYEPTHKCYEICLRLSLRWTGLTHPPPPVQIGRVKRLHRDYIHIR